MPPPSTLVVGAPFAGFVRFGCGPDETRYFCLGFDNGLGTMREGGKVGRWEGGNEAADTHRHDRKLPRCLPLWHRPVASFSFIPLQRRHWTYGAKTATHAHASSVLGRKGELGVPLRGRTTVPPFPKLLDVAKNQPAGINCSPANL